MRCRIRFISCCQRLGGLIFITIYWCLFILSKSALQSLKNGLVLIGATEMFSYLVWIDLKFANTALQVNQGAALHVFENLFSLESTIAISGTLELSFWTSFSQVLYEIRQGNQTLLKAFRLGTTHFYLKDSFLGDCRTLFLDLTLTVRALGVAGTSPTVSE